MSLPVASPKRSLQLPSSKSIANFPKIHYTTFSVLTRSKFVTSWHGQKSVVSYVVPFSKFYYDTTDLLLTCCELVVCL